MEGKVGITKHLKSLNPGKAIAMAICPIIVHFITRSMHDDLSRELTCAVKAGFH